MIFDNFLVTNFCESKKQQHAVNVNQSVYNALSGQQPNITIINFLLHVPNHLLKDLHMLIYALL